mgnify:CR=1 FL=1
MMANGRLKNIVLAAVTVLAVSGCAKDGAIDVSSGVGVSVTRSGCPPVAVPDYSEGARIYTEATFDVRAVRSNAAGARTVTVPYFSTVVQGGTAVVAKRVNNVTLQFADGAYRASASGKAGSYIDASAARLPEDVIERLTKRRKPGDPDAALDPLADPAVKAAVARSSFELLIGFQLTQAQLQYNATR